MAARKNKVQLTQTWKDKIQASVIGLRLYDHMNGDVEMTSTQIKAADILLKKLVPDLARTEVTGLDGAPQQHSIIVNFVKPVVLVPEVK